MTVSPGRPTVLCIGGSDPIGAAGIQADLRHLAALGVHGAAAPTALTVQTVDEFRRYEPTSGAVFRESLEAAFESLPVEVVLIGMLATEAHLRTLLVVLHNFEGKIVVDPVFHASAGAALLDGAGRALAAEALLVRAHVVLPNVDELGALAGVAPPTDEAERATLAEELVAQGAELVLAKGGHAAGDHVVDLLATPAGVERLVSPRVPGRFRGTGGALAAAVAAGLACGRDATTAVKAARETVYAALCRAAAVPTPFLHLNEPAAP
jgi:hydroxymethylpyrimidine/phosphomethylpyrimidine kinase